MWKTSGSTAGMVPFEKSRTFPVTISDVPTSSAAAWVTASSKSLNFAEKSSPDGGICYGSGFQPREEFIENQKVFGRTELPLQKISDGGDGMPCNISFHSPLRHPKITFTS